MSGQILGPVCLEVLEFAFILLIKLMSKNMKVEHILSVKSFGADFTLKNNFSSMFSSMTPQAALACKILTAELTLKWVLTCVCSSMFVKTVS